MMDLCELYWAAGFLEGEGSFGAFTQGLRSWYRLAVQCAQVQEEPLLRLQTLFGGKVYKHKQRQANHKDSFTWALWNNDAAGVMMTLWTLMSPRRKLQIEESLNKWKMNKNQSEAAKLRWQKRKGIVEL